ncbi:MAG: heme exporter protein CcmB [Armatimonadetes bacterium]|nr:heme exporter protein CcmB [Armatimonadota bacterium]
MSNEPSDWLCSPPIAPNTHAGATSFWRWGRETLAIWRKDMLQEWRLRHGLMTSLLMGVVTVAALSFASLGVSLSVRLQAGVLWLAVLFGMFPALARGFISEEELGTADLLRLGARPSCVFWGKWLFHLTLYIVLSAVLVPLYMLMIAPLAGAWWAWLVLWGLGGVGLVTVLTLCGALVAGTASRGALLAVVTFPLLLPMVLMLIAATEQILQARPMWQSLQGILGYGLTLSAGAAWIFEKIWRE